MIFNMEVLIVILIGLIMGYIMYKIKSEFWGYLFGISPYLIFFILSINNRDVWGHYRILGLLPQRLLVYFALFSEN